MKQFISKKHLFSVAMILASMQVCAQSGTSGSAPEGAVAVDLGLPSGTKWANMNVGATKPEEFGLYFAWGETVGYANKQLKDVEVLDEAHFFDWEHYKWCSSKYSGEDNITKYCTDSARGKVDNKTTLDLEDDAAYVNWGSSWRMPTRAEVVELFENTKVVPVYKGVLGLIFVSKSNGNSIFLPATGFREKNCAVAGSPDGYYWTSTVASYYSASAHIFNIHSSGLRGFDIRDRHYGLTIRPVHR